MFTIHLKLLSTIKLSYFGIGRLITNQQNIYIE